MHLKKISYPLSTFIQLIVAHKALAQSDIRKKIDKAAGDYYKTLTGAESGQLKIAEFIGLLINALLGFLGVLFMILIIYAGYLWMTARGNEDQVNRSQTILRNSVIGMVIVSAAYAIVLFAGYIIGKGGFLK